MAGVERRSYHDTVKNSLAQPEKSLYCLSLQFEDMVKVVVGRPLLKISLLTVSIAKEGYSVVEESCKLGVKGFQRYSDWRHFRGLP